MNFLEAINALKQGKKVRRPCWEKDSYWKLGKKEEIAWVDGTKAQVHINQIEATDWEIYEEDNWNLAEKGQAITCKKYPYYKQEDIKIFIQKAKQKIRNGMHPEQAIDETAGDL